MTEGSGRHPPTAVSAITEDFVSTAVRTRMTEFEAANSTKVAEFQTRLDSLEDTIADIHSTVDTISSKMAGAVLNLLTSPNGILTKQDQKLDAQNVIINRLFEMLSTLTNDVQRSIGTPTEAMAAKPTPASPIHKRHCPDNRSASSPESATDDSMEHDEDSMEHDNPAGMQ
jgi:uncharacterized coiled-coil protein SlyX